MTLPRKGDRVRVTASAAQLNGFGITEPLPIGTLGEVRRAPPSADAAMYVRFETGLERHVCLGEHVEIAVCQDCNNHGVIPGSEPGLSEPCGNPFHAPMPETALLTDCIKFTRDEAIATVLKAFGERRTALLSGTYAGRAVRLTLEALAAAGAFSDWPCRHETGEMECVGPCTCGTMADKLDAAGIQ